MNNILMMTMNTIHIHRSKCIKHTLCIILENKTKILSNSCYVLCGMHGHEHTAAKIGN